MSTTYPNSYATVEDVYQVLPQIGSLTNVVSANISYQIGRVEADMNARLSKVFTLPFSTTILQLTTIATDLTIYELSKRFAVLASLKQAKSFDEYKRSYMVLDDIVSGKIPLLDSSNEAIELGSGSGVVAYSNNSGFTPTFNEQEPEDQELDPDKND